MCIRDRCYIFHDLAVVTKRVCKQCVLITDHVGVPDDFLQRCYEYLAKCECDSLPQLVRIGYSIGEELARHEMCIRDRLYAKAGAVDEARTELDLLEKENPNSPIVAQLKASLDQATPSPIRTKAAQ